MLVCWSAQSSWSLIYLLPWGSLPEQREWTWGCSGKLICNWNEFDERRVSDTDARLQREACLLVRVNDLNSRGVWVRGHEHECANVYCKESPEIQVLLMWELNKLNVTEAQCVCVYLATWPFIKVFFVNIAAKNARLCCSFFFLNYFCAFFFVEN